MANSADPDQLASSKANWSGSTLFVKGGYIWVQRVNESAAGAGDLCIRIVFNCQHVFISIYSKLSVNYYHSSG